MSKSEEYRLHVQKGDKHDYRRKLKEVMDETNDQDAKEQLRRYRYGDFDNGQRAPVSPEE